MMTGMRCVWLLGGALTLGACAAADPMTMSKFTDASRVTLTSPRTLGIARIINRIPPGQQIATVTIGIFCAGGEKVYERAGGGTEVRNDRFFIVIRDELKAAGFKFPGDDGSLFPNPQEWKPDLLLAGAVLKAASNVCQPKAGFGNRVYASAESSIEIEWQLFDRGQSRVVMTKTTGGSARRDEMDHGWAEAQYAALAMAVRNLLATPEFIAATKPVIGSRRPEERSTAGGRTADGSPVSPKIR